jgi:hypothetical protein
VLSGYDVYLGNPSPTRAMTDPGFKHQIFDERYSGTTVDGSGEQLPDGVTELQCTGSCSLEADVSTFSDASSYSALLSSKVEFDISFFDDAFGASFDYQRIERETSAGEKVYMQAQAQCCAYTAKVDYFSPPPFTADFVKAVELAPTEYDSDFYLKIVQQYGTHYVVSADMGAVYGQQTEFTWERYTDMVSLLSDWSLYAKASFILSITASAGSGLQKNQSKTFESYISSRSVYSLGSKPPTTGKLDDWVQQAMGSPAPMHTELEPISSLFSEQFFPSVNMSALGAKKANVERALKEYCPHYLLPQGKISSCDPPSKEDPDPDAQHRTCLGKTDVFGGHGGMPFDDGVGNITQNGLSSELEVSKVEYTTTSIPGVYVQSLQLALRQGNQEWFLTRHGAQGDAGSCKVPVDQGTKITAVQVSWCDYVNSLTFYTSESYDDEQELGGPGGCHTTMLNFQDEADRQFNITTSQAWLVGLLGRSDEWMDSVGFYFAYLAPPGEDCHGGIEVPRPS